LAVAQAVDETPALPSAEVYHPSTRSSSIWMMLLLNLTQVTGTLSASPNQPLVILQEPGPSRAPIIVESSSSDEPMAPVLESRVTVSQTQLEEIRFKEVRDLPP